MALPTFGVDESIIKRETYGRSYSDGDWPAIVAGWVQRASAELTVILRECGYSAIDANALGENSDLYLNCSSYIVHHVTVALIRSIARADTDLSKSHAAEFNRIKKFIRSSAASLMDREDRPDEVIGVFSLRRSPLSRRRGGNRRTSRLLRGLKAGG